MRTSKKLIIGTAALLAVVAGMQAQDFLTKQTGDSNYKIHYGIQNIFNMANHLETAEGIEEFVIVKNLPAQWGRRGLPPVIDFSQFPNLKKVTFLTAPKEADQIGIRVGNVRPLFECIEGTRKRFRYEPDNEWKIIKNKFVRAYIFLGRRRHLLVFFGGGQLQTSETCTSENEDWTTHHRESPLPFKMSRQMLFFRIKPERQLSTFQSGHFRVR